MKPSIAGKRVIAILYLGTLTFNAMLLYLAWDGAQTIQQAQAQAEQAFNHDESYFRAIYHHYHPGRFVAGEVIVNEFISVSYYTGMFYVAPFTRLVVALVFGFTTNWRWRWLIISVALIIAMPLLLSIPTLSHIAHIID